MDAAIRKTIEGWPLQIKLRHYPPGARLRGGSHSGVKYPTSILIDHAQSQIRSAESAPRHTFRGDAPAEAGERVQRSQVSVFRRPETLAGIRAPDLRRDVLCARARSGSER